MDYNETPTKGTEMKLRDLLKGSIYLYVVVTATQGLWALLSKTYKHFTSNRK